MRIKELGIVITHGTAKTKAETPMIDISYILEEKTDAWDRLEWLKTIMTADFPGRPDKEYHFSFTDKGYPRMTTTVTKVGLEWIKEKYSF